MPKKRSKFDEIAEELNGMSVEQSAKKMGKSEHVLLNEIYQRGGGAIKIKDGKIIVDVPSWREIREVTGHRVTGTRTAESYEGRHARNKKTADYYIKTGGLSIDPKEYELNWGTSEGWQRLDRILGYIYGNRKTAEEAILNQIAREGTLGRGEKLG